MPTATTAALLAALSFLATPPEKQSWEETDKKAARADFLPRSALIEVDGKERGRGFVKVDVTDPKQTFRVRVSAEGFEPEEAVVVAGNVIKGEHFLALRPAGFAGRVDVRDAGSMALAASALWKAGRLDDAVDYAEQSLRGGNTPLANRVLGEVWRRRGNRDQAVRYFAMYLSISDNPSDGDEIRAWLMQDRPGDITIPAK